MARLKKDIDRELMYKKILPTATIVEEKSGVLKKINEEDTEGQNTPVMEVSIADPVKVIIAQGDPNQASSPAVTVMPQSKEVIKEAPVLTAEPSVAPPKDEVPSTANAEPILVNLMEGFLEKRLEAALTKFKCCSCEKCRKDVLAMALNKLPPLYVIEDDPDQRDLHERERSAQVTTALVQAILAVKARPTHG